MNNCKFTIAYWHDITQKTHLGKKCSYGVGGLKCMENIAAKTYRV